MWQANWQSNRLQKGEGGGGCNGRRENWLIIRSGAKLYTGNGRINKFTPVLLGLCDSSPNLNEKCFLVFVVLLRSWRRIEKAGMRRHRQTQPLCLLVSESPQEPGYTILTSVSCLLDCDRDWFVFGRQYSFVYQGGNPPTLFSNSSDFRHALQFSWDCLEELYVRTQMSESFALDFFWKLFKWAYVRKQQVTSQRASGRVDDVSKKRRTQNWKNTIMSEWKQGAIYEEDADEDVHLEIRWDSRAFGDNCGQRSCRDDKKLCAVN